VDTSKIFSSPPPLPEILGTYDDQRVQSFANPPESVQITHGKLERHKVTPLSGKKCVATHVGSQAECNSWHTTSSFRDESRQATDCTHADMQTNDNQQ